MGLNQLLKLTLEQADGDAAEEADAKEQNSLLGKLGSFASMARKKSGAKIALAK